MASAIVHDNAIADLDGAGADDSQRGLVVGPIAVGEHRCLPNVLRPRQPSRQIHRALQVPGNFLQPGHVAGHRSRQSVGQFLRNEV